MQRLARSANSKNKYQSELHTMKKELKVARSELRNIENQLSVVLSNTKAELQRQIGDAHADIGDPPKSANGPEEIPVDLKNEQSETKYDLRVRIDQLETALATVRLHRDEFQDDLNASEESLKHLSEQFNKCQEELENLKSKIPVWQATTEQGQTEGYEQRLAIGDLQPQLTKSNEALQAERAQNNTTCTTLKDTSKVLESIRSALETSKLKLQGLQAECDILQHERTAATKTQADLVYAARAKDVELVKTK
jgi:chromosome segregation ATPase